MKVLVLYGGLSSERAVSLRSGAEVVAALKAKGHEVLEHDTQTEATVPILTSADVVFIALHGEGGEDGFYQKKLEALHVPFVGSGSQASEFCMDKWAYKEWLTANHYPHPYGELVDSVSFWHSDLITRPFVLKTRGGGSSVDMLLVRDASVQPDANVVGDLFSRHPEMLLERLIEGIEITAGILGYRALPIIEIVPPANGEFDYENKYNGASQELCPPVNVSPEIQLQAQEMALAIHNATGCRDISRTDMLIDAGGQLNVLETNTIPGFTKESTFPKAVVASGTSMPDFVSLMVDSASARTSLL
ncbi:MAG: D-alanine--D-alanine ligase [Candidatus Saccharibacteria bacterium]|nr:D-alanine--D-alanine ligase [Candidatus Saccharibacteria bacterium]